MGSANPQVKRICGPCVGCLDLPKGAYRKPPSVSVARPIRASVSAARASASKLSRLVPVDEELNGLLPARPARHAVSRLHRDTDPSAPVSSRHEPQIRPEWP